jgi:hypothetical protein
MQGGRKLSQWNLFVKKIYREGHSKNSKYDFKQALQDASNRKSEMGSMKNNSGRGKTNRKSRSKRSMAGGTRRRRKY